MRKALVVGIDDYPGARLKGCINDANTVAALLDKNADGSPNFAVKLFTTVKTKAELKSIILKTFNDSDDDVSLLYFSGHGVVTESGGGYIVTPDFTREDVGISMDEILKMAGLSKARHKIVMLDCCHAGAMGAPAMMGNSAAFLEQGLIILASSRSSETSVESNGHGVFTGLLIDALKGGAADIDGEVTPGNIYSYIDKALGSWHQRPVFKANIVRSISLRKVNPTVSKAELRLLLEYFPEVDKEFPLDPSYEYTTTTDNPNEKNINTFKILRRMQLIGLVEPVGEEYLYWAAVRNKSCRLTGLGAYYWKLVKDGRI